MNKNATQIWQAPVLQLFLALFCVFSAAACTYQFTNQHVATPEGVHSIAVEAIYDTSREALPHELLWESLQAAFAADGHLRLVAQSQADALVRVHLKNATVQAVGSNLPNDKYPRDGSIKNNDPTPYSQKTPPKPSDFKNLAEAGQYRDGAQLTTVAYVEVWNLNTHALLLHTLYPLTQTFHAIHSGKGITPVANDHLRYDEATRATFKALADIVAAGVVRDLLVR